MVAGNSYSTNYGDESLYEALDAFIQARDNLNRIKELRRMQANEWRVNANAKDSKTDLVVEEANEVAPIDTDYEPVSPNLPVDEE